MTKVENPLLIDSVRPEWIDYNGHMTDSAYAILFSLAVDQFMVKVGIDEDYREKAKYSIFTLETHLCYLKEAHKGQVLQVSIQLLDYDSKRLHVFFTMENEKGERLATSEQMLMGMNMEDGRPAAFPEKIQINIDELSKAQTDMEVPKEAGRQIGIRKK